MPTEQLTIGIAIISAAVAVAGYFGNKYGKSQQVRIDQGKKDSEQDNRITTVSNSNKSLWRQVDKQAIDIKELQSTNTQIQVLQESFNNLDRRFENMETNIQNIFRLLRKDKGG